MRKRFLATLLCGLLGLSVVLAGCGSNAPASTTPTPQSRPDTPAPAKTIEITLGHVLKTTDGYQVAAEKFKEVVESRSNGQIKVNIVPDGKLGAEKDMLTKTQSGEIQASIITHGSVTSFVPEFAILDTPFLVRDYDHGHRILDGEIGQALQQGLSKAGFEPLGLVDFGYRYLTNSKVAVRTPADAKGLQMRVLPNAQYQATWEALTGKAPIVLNWTEVMDALKSGKIDGQENPISLLVSFKLWETQKYATKTGHVFAAAVFVMNPQTFQSLSPEQQAIVRDAGKEAVMASRKFLAESEAKGWQTLKENGMVVVEEIDREAFRKAVWDQVVPKFNHQFPADWLDKALKL